MRTGRRHISGLRSGMGDRSQVISRSSPLSEAGFSTRTLHGSGWSHGGHQSRTGARGRLRSALPAAILAAVAILCALLIAVLLEGAGVQESASALASIGLPLGGGRIVKVGVYHGPHSAALPIRLEGTRIYPRTSVPAGERLTVEATVKRPGWLGWLTGSTEHIRRVIVTPRAQLRSQFLTLPAHATLMVSFTTPVRAIAYGSSPGQMRRRVLPAPSREVKLPRAGLAGSLLVSATPRTWERSTPAPLSWFPPGSSSDVVAAPAPGSSIAPGTPITLTFSQPVSRVLGSARPALSPKTAGSWQMTGPHTLVFHPAGYGYGLGTNVTVGLPGGVHTIGGAASTLTWSVPAGSTLRLQELLGELGYLPLTFSDSTHVAANPLAQEEAAIHPPQGSFTWRYGNTPASLRSFWSPTEYTIITKGALMAFENEHEMAPEGVPTAAVWSELIKAALAHQRYTFGYSYVSVSKSEQRLVLWHDGRTILTTPVNTGIAASPTEAGTFAVYEHLRSTTMSGTNPNGSHYEDPGVPWVSYFNGGDALHGFERAAYGFPQSLGCVEMPPATAGEVWPYTPIGTLVHIEE